MGKQISRREMVACSAVGVSAAALCGLSGAGGSALASEASDASGLSEDRRIGVNGDPSAQYGFIMNAQMCIDCGECVDACRIHNGTSLSKPRRKVTSYRTKAGKELFISTSCMHCGKPSCAEVCPAGAIQKEVGGIVVVDKNLCIGCKYCYQACPFEVPQYDSVSMDKCDFCFGAGVALGDSPYCVKACKSQALRFGKLEDLVALSDRARRIAGPTEPSAVLV